VGKSTLLLQVATSLNPPNTPNTPTVLYISGEESPEQLKLRADRLGLNTENIQVLAETDVDLILQTLPPPATLPTLLIIDSIQTLITQDPLSASGGSAPAGSVSQVRECSSRLAKVAKEKKIPLILLGHITKEGTIAGPKVLEHLVDVVLHLEGDKFHTFRLLRTHKNRFGSDQEVGVFEMGDRGLKEVKNPSDIFLSERLTGASGSVVTATMEGSRPVLVEIQALATPTSLAYPRRTSAGFSLNRLNLITAVLQKHLKLNLQNKDIYVNVAGGFRISEPAADLAGALAIVSSVKNQPIGPKVCAFGEVGLSGEVRKVSQTDRRIKEARKLGFSEIISPANARSLQEALGRLS
jgi:DNA repair protein RadA/Sms